MARFDPTIYNPATQIISQNYQNLGNTFAQLMQNQRAKEEAKVAAQMKQASDPAYILAQVRQGFPITPEQQAILDIAQAKAQKAIIDPETGALVQVGGFPTYGAQQSMPQNIPQGMPEGMLPPPSMTEEQRLLSQAQTPRERAAIREGLVKEEFEKRKEARTTEAQSKKDLMQSEELKRTLDTLLNSKDLGEISGSLQGGFSSSEYVPAFMKSDTQRKLQPLMNKLKGQQFLQAYQSLRGGGQITEVEGVKAEQAQAALSQNMSDEDFRNALSDYRKVIENGIARLKGQKPPHNFEPAQQAQGGIAEGTTATNPQTGEKIIFRGGQWQKM